jgi:hypothetical protein
MVRQVGRWFSLQLSGRWIGELGARVVNGLNPNNADGTPNEESWTEACRRYKAHLAEQRAQRKQPKEPEPPKPPAPKRCSFCREPQSATDILVGDGFTLICASCSQKVAAIFAEQHKQ